MRIKKNFCGNGKTANEQKKIETETFLPPQAAHSRTKKFIILIEKSC